jgi:hypothetical protein
MTIDTGSTSFNLLIPAIGLTSIGATVDFTTDAIVTSHPGPDSFPRSGVFERYEFIPVQGKASFLIAFFAPLLEQFSKAAGG